MGDKHVEPLDRLGNSSKYQTKASLAHSRNLIDWKRNFRRSTTQKLSSGPSVTESSSHKLIRAHTIDLSQKHDKPELESVGLRPSSISLPVLDQYEAYKTGKRKRSPEEFHREKRIKTNHTVLDRETDVSHPSHARVNKQAKHKFFIPPDPQSNEIGFACWRKRAPKPVVLVPDSDPSQSTNSGASQAVGNPSQATQASLPIPSQPEEPQKPMVPVSSTQTTVYSSISSQQNEDPVTKAENNPSKPQPIHDQPKGSNVTEATPEDSDSDSDFKESSITVSETDSSDAEPETQPLILSLPDTTNPQREHIPIIDALHSWSTQYISNALETAQESSQEQPSSTIGVAS